MCTITFCRGDFLATVYVMNEILMYPDDPADCANNGLVDLRKFFLDRPYDSDREQGIGAPFLRREALLNDLYAARSLTRGVRNLPSPKPQRIIILGVILALLVPLWRRRSSFQKKIDGP